ncbi:hypothetical protein Tco_0587678 [Tanacetum coccineum]
MPSLADPNAEENVGQSSTGLTASESGPDVSFASLLKGDSKVERYANSAYGFFLGKRVAYPVVANYVKNAWGKYGLDVNLMKEDVVNVSVWVKLHGIPIAAFTEDGLSVIAMNIGIPLMLESYRSDMCIQSWGRSSYARALIEIRADVEFKDTIVMAMLKLTGRGFIRLGMAKNLKKPSQASRGVPVRMKVGSKPAKEYRPIAKKPTDNTSDIKKKGVKYQWGASNLASNRANSSGTSFWNVETSTPIVDKIGKLEKLIIEGKVTLVDDDGIPLKKVDYPGDHDSDDEVCLVDNDMTRSMATETVGFGTKSLPEQWTDSYVNGDYDEDPYDDDMYEGQDLPDKLQDICDNLDIRVRAGDAKPSRQTLTPSSDSLKIFFFLSWKTKSTLPSSSNVVSKKVDDVVNNDKDKEVEEVYDEIATYMAYTGFNVNKASKNGSGRGNKSLYEQ